MDRSLARTPPTGPLDLLLQEADARADAADLWPPGLGGRTLAELVVFAACSAAYAEALPAALAALVRRLPNPMHRERLDAARGCGEALTAGECAALAHAGLPVAELAGVPREALRAGLCGAQRPHPDERPRLLGAAQRWRDGLAELLADESAAFVLGALALGCGTPLRSWARRLAPLAASPLLPVRARACLIVTAAADPPSQVEMLGLAAACVQVPGLGTELRRGMLAGLDRWSEFEGLGQRRTRRVRGVA